MDRDADRRGNVIAMDAVADTNDSGQVSLGVSSGCADVIVDVTGWFEPLAT